MSYHFIEEETKYEWWLREPIMATRRRWEFPGFQVDAIRIATQGSVIYRLTEVHWGKFFQVEDREDTSEPIVEDDSFYPDQMFTFVDDMKTCLPLIFKTNIPSHVLECFLDFGVNK